MRKPPIPFISNQYYHVFNRAVGNEKLFPGHQHYEFFLTKMQEYILPIADIFSFNLLPGHFHLFIRIKPLALIEERFIAIKHEKDRGKYEPNRSRFIAEQFANWFNSFTKKHNHSRHRKGKLFLDNLKRLHITEKELFGKVLHYIHANVIQHGICSNMKEWPYSSYPLYLSPEPTWICKEEMLTILGGIEAFLGFHQQPSEPAMKRRRLTRHSANLYYHHNIEPASTFFLRRGTNY